MNAATPRRLLAAFNGGRVNLLTCSQVADDESQSLSQTVTKMCEIVKAQRSPRIPQWEAQPLIFYILLNFYSNFDGRGSEPSL